MKNLDLTDEEEAALIKEHRARPLPPLASHPHLEGILAKLRPEAAGEPLPSPKVYAPPRATAARRRRSTS
jgi:hypothetical protein